MIKKLFHVIKETTISFVDLIFCMKFFFGITNDRRIIDEENFVKIVSITMLQNYVNNAKKKIKKIMKMFMQKYKINIVSKNEIANLSHDLRRELLNKKLVQLRNFIENLFETIILISKKMKISRSKRVK